MGADILKKHILTVVVFLLCAASPASAQFLSTYVSGCILSPSVAFPNTKLDVSWCSAADDTHTTQLNNAGGVIDTATTGIGGLDAGPLQASKSYHAFIVATSGGATGFIASLSPTAPAGYTVKRRIGVITTNTSSQIIPFVQIGGEFWLKTYRPGIWEAHLTNLQDSSPFLLALASIPTGVSVKAFVRINLGDDFVGGPGSGNALSFRVSQLGTNLYSSGGLGPIGFDAFYAHTAEGAVDVWTDTSARIAIEWSVFVVRSTTFAYISVAGWYDPRGQ